MKKTSKIFGGVLLLIFGFLFGILIKTALAQSSHGRPTYHYECQHIQLGWDKKGNFIVGSQTLDNKSADGWKILSIIECPESGNLADKQKDYIVVWEQQQ